MKTTSDVRELYTVRAIACLTVVLLHSMEAVASLRPGLGSAWTTVSIVLKFATPVFVMLSAFTMAHAYNTRPTPDGLFKKRSTALFPPFLIMAALSALVSWTSDDNLHGNFIDDLLANIFLAGYHGYFILIVLQFVLIFPAFKKLTQRYGLRTLIAWSAAINVLYLGVFNLIPAPAGADLIWDRLSWLPFPGWLFFFATAYSMGADVNRTRALVTSRMLSVSLATLLAAAAVAFLFSSSILPVPSSKRLDMLAFAPLMFLFLFGIGRGRPLPGPFLAFISKHSFGIYLLHLIGIPVAYKLIRPVSGTLPASIETVLLFVLATTLSIAGTILLQKIPYGHLVVGKSGRTPLMGEASQVR